MADLVIGHLQHLTAGLQELHPSASSQSLDALSGRQPFLLGGNWGHTHSACILENDFPSLVAVNRGWQWVDEGKTRQQHKRGFVSLTPGSQLKIRVGFLSRAPEAHSAPSCEIKLLNVLPGFQTRGEE